MAQKNKQNFSSYKKHLQGKTQEKSRGHVKADEIFSVQEANDRLYDIFRTHSFEDFPHDKRILLAQFYSLLMSEQNKQNFTRITKFRDIAIKHFIDCLIVANLQKIQFPLLDVGTGPGFPGVPLKILFPEKEIYLAEGVQKRVEFLKTVREELKLSNLGIFGRNIGPNFLYPVRGVITRAVEEVNNTLANVFYCLQTGGQVYFMKGPNANEELERLDPKWSKYYELTANTEYVLPNTEHKRRLLVFTKIRQAPLEDMDFFQDLDYKEEEELSNR